MLYLIYQRREMFGGTAAFTTAGSFESGAGHMRKEFVLKNAVGSMVDLLYIAIEDGIAVLVHGLFRLPFL